MVEEILELVQQKVSPKDIQQRLGLSRAKLYQVLKAHNLTGYDCVSEDIPHGLNSNSHAIRVRLGAALYDLRERLGGNRAEVGRLVGLTRIQQINAEARPWIHDWTLSQIDRLCDATGKTMTELVNGSQ